MRRGILLTLVLTVTLALLEEGELLKAVLNVLLSVVLCLGATWIGIVTGRQL